MDHMHQRTESPQVTPSWKAGCDESRLSGLGGGSTKPTVTTTARRVVSIHITEFAGRTEAHERNFAGGYDANRIETYLAAEHQGLNATFKAMVDECMSHYDLNGWTHPTWAEVPWSIPKE
jgi:hypothetical protein